MKKGLQLLLFCTGLVCTNALAQTESTLYFMNSIPQVVDTNPANMPRYKMSIGLPIISSVGAVYSNNGFAYNDLISKVDGVVKADLSKLTKSLTEKNYVTQAAQTDLFRFGLRVDPKIYLMASATVKGYNRTMIPLGLVSLLVDGTAPLVGTFSNTSPQEEAISFLETNIGMAYKVTDNLTVGGRVKYLKGLANATTESSSLIVQVGDTYQVTATGSALVRTSGVSNFNTSGYNVGDHVGDYLKNNGWGIDLGATYKFLDKLTLGASLTDIGYITWKNDTYQYTLDPAKATYTFSGIDINKLANNNSNYLSGQLDSLKNKFQMKEAPTGSYTTMLPGKFYLSGNYELVKNLSVGALFFGEKFRDRFTTGVTAAATKHFGKWMSTSLSYTVSNRSYNNIGLGLSFNVAPVQLYVVGDNLIGASASPNSAHLLTVRAGLNLVFGWDKGTTRKQEKGDGGIPRTKTSNSIMKTTVGGNPNPKSKSSKGKIKTTVGQTPNSKSNSNKVKITVGPSPEKSRKKK